MQFDIEGARKAGYSDDEIADHLGTQRGFDTRAARDAGYSTAEIMAHLSDSWARKPLPAGVTPASAGGGRGGLGGPTAEMAAGAAKPSVRRGGTVAELRRGAYVPGDSAGAGRGRVNPAVVVPSEPAAGGSVLDVPAPGYVETPQDLQARAEWDSLSPQGQAKAMDLMRYEAGKRRGSISPLSEEGFGERMLDSTLRKPMDNSLAGAALETAGDAARGIGKAGVRLAQSAWGAIQAGADAVGADGLSDLAGESVKAGERTAAGLGNRQAPNSLTERVFESTFTSVPIALGAPGAPLRALMAQSAAQEYGQSRARGLDAGASAERAVYMGLAEGLGERFGMPQLQQLFTRAAQQATGKELGRILADMLVKEQLGEQVTTALQAGYEKVGARGLNPGATLADYLAEAAETAKVTLGQSLLTGGLAGGVRKAAGEQSRASQLAGALEADIAETPEVLLNRAIDASPYGAARRLGFHVDPPMYTESPMTQRKKVEDIFRNAASSIGMSRAAVDAALQAAERKPLSDLGGFFSRFTAAAGRRGLAAADVAPEILEAMSHGAIRVPGPTPKAAPMQVPVPAAASAAVEPSSRTSYESDLQHAGYTPAEIAGMSDDQVKSSRAAAAMLYRQRQGDSVAASYDPNAWAERAELNRELEADIESGRVVLPEGGISVTLQDRGKKSADYDQRLAEAEAETLDWAQQEMTQLKQEGGPAEVRAFAVQSLERELQDGRLRDDRGIYFRDLLDRMRDPAAAPARADAPIDVLDTGSVLSALGIETDGATRAPEVAAPPASIAAQTDVDQRAHAAATSPTNDRPEPTQAQKEAGNYAKGHVRVAGLDIAIENPQGSVRRGVDRDGTAWENTLQSHYGYIKGTLGNDKDHVDLFIKPGTPDDYAGPVFVIDQVHPDTGKFDEHKVVLGVATEDEARQLYQANYATGWNGAAAVTRLPIQAFKSWVKDGAKREPLGDINARAKIDTAPAEAPQNQPAPAAPGPAAAPSAGAAGAAGVPAAGELDTAQTAGLNAREATASMSGATLEGATQVEPAPVSANDNAAGSQVDSEAIGAAEAVLSEAEIQALQDDDIPDLYAELNSSPEALMRALGFTEQEIADELAREQAAAAQAGDQQDRQASPRAEGESSSRTGRQEGRDAAPGEAEGLTLSAQTDRSTQQRFPRADSLEYISVGPGGIRPRVIAPGRRLFRETSISGISDLLRADRQFDVAQLFVADNPDLAIGQGANKGVLVEFRPDSLSGREHRKPGTGELAGREYRTDVVAPRAVARITIDSAQRTKGLPGLARRVLSEQFDRTVLDDGRIQYLRKGLAAEQGASDQLSGVMEVAATAPIAAESRFTASRNADGTVLVAGDPAAVRLALPGFRGISGRRGVTYGRSVAESVVAALEGVPAPRTEASDARMALGDGRRAGELPRGVRDSDDPTALRLVARVQEFVDAATGGPGRHPVIAVDLTDEAGDELKAARTLARAVFGHKMIFVRQPKGRMFDGIAAVDGERVVYIDVNSGKPVLAVLGHELLHRMRGSNPDLYARFKKALDAVMTDGGRYAAELNAKRARKGLPPLDQDILAEERIADVVGDQFTDQRFWRELAQADRGLFQRIGDAVLQFIDDVVAKITKRRPFGTDQFIRDLTAARAAVVDAMREFAVSQTGAAEPGRGQLRMALSVLDQRLRRASTFSEARLAAGAFQGKEITNADTGFKAVVSRNSLDKMLSGKAALKSADSRAHAMAVANADKLFEAAILGWSRPDTQGDGLNIVAVHRFFAPLEVDGKAMMVKLTVKETARRDQPNPLYTVESVDLNEEAPAAQWVDSTVRSDGIDPTSIRSAGAVVSLAEAIQSRNEGQDKGARMAVASAESTPGQAASAWRDETGRIQFAPGKWLADRLGAAAAPLLERLSFKAASPALRRQMRAMKLQVAKAQEVATDVAGAMAKFSPAERQMVSDIIERELETGVMPPSHAVRMAAGINQVLGQQTDELVRLGMLSKESADEWRGQYLPRFYESKIKQAADPWIAAVKKAVARTPVMQGIRGKSLRGRGLWETVPTKDLPDWEALGWEVRDKSFDPATSAEVQVWRDFTRAERDNMGEIRDAGFRFVMGYMRTQRDIALGQLFEGIAANPEMSSRVQKPDWVHVPDGTVDGTGVKRYGKLAGMWVPQEVMSHLSQYEEADSAALAMYRKAMGAWKEMKTVLNPVSHVNNVLSNLTMAHLAGVSYWDGHKYLGAMRDLVQRGDAFQEAKDAGLFLGSMKAEELIDQLPKELQQLARMQESNLAKGGRWVFNAMSWFARRPLGAAYEAEDLFFRYLIYRDARTRGLEPADAVDYSQRYIFTYDDLPKGARRVRDFAMPFFAYTYKAVPVLLQTALTHPHRMLAPAAALWAANALAYAMAAGGADEDWLTRLMRYLQDPARKQQADELQKAEREHIPSWLKGTTALGTPKAIRLGMDELSGLPLFIDVSRIIPGGDLFDVSPNAGGVPWPQPITPSHPLFSTYSAMFANRDTFTGKDLVDLNDTRAESAEKRAAWLWKQFSPAIAVNNYHWERGMNALAHAMGGELKYVPAVLGGDATGIGRDGLPVQAGYAAMQTFGIKVRPYDLEAAAAIEGAQKDKLIKSIDAEIRTLRRLHGKGAVSGEQLQREMDAAAEKKARLSDGLTVDGDKKD